MSGQLLFFRKNRADYENTGVIVTCSQGNENGDYILDRSNRTAWGTSGSVDADNTTIEVDLGEVQSVTDILLVAHNFKSYTLKYWDEVGLAWTNFSTSIAPTTNTAATTWHQFTSVQTSKFLLTILGTMVVDSDKILCQFIATTQVGQLAGWPVIKSPTISRGLQEQKMLSGKSNIVSAVGFYSASLVVDCWQSSADLDIVEDLYGSPEGFLVWPCGGDQTQFASVRQGYRLEDIFLVRCKNEFKPEWREGLYKMGLKLQIDLVEVIT
jgi:hypothetical protein